ncbi:MAG: GAF domain-containing protein, partial [Chloroflexota bacterium]
NVILGRQIALATDNPTTRPFKQKHPYVISDTGSDPAWEVWPEAEDIKSWVGTPLLIGDEPIGVLTIESTVRGTYDSIDTQVLQIFANQAAIAINNAHLFKEAQQQRQIAEGLQEVATILNSSLDPDLVLTKMLEQLQLVIPYDDAGILLKSGDALTLLADSSGDFSGSDFKIPMTSNDPAARVFKSQKPLVIADVHLDPGWEIWEGGDRIRSWIGTPLFLDDEPIGVLTTDRFEIDSYRPSDAKILQTFATQAAIAIENARLFNQEQRQRQIAESLREVSIALNSTLDQEKMLDIIFDQLEKVIEYDGAALFLLKEGALELNSGRNLPASLIGVREPLSSENPTLTPFHSKKTLVIGNVREHPDWVVWDDDEMIRSWMGAPLMAQEVVIGVLTLDNFKVDAYQEADAKVFQIFANQAAIAIQNAQLYAEAQDEIEARRRTEADLAHARDQALEASRLKSELLAKVSHELRTPLNAIMGYAELLQSGVYGPIDRKQEKPLDKLINSSYYLTNLVGELLDQAKLDAGRLELDISSFPVAQLAEQLQSQMSILAQNKGLVFSIELSDNMPTHLINDQIRLQQILTNLIGNAIKFTKEGRVEVCFSRLNNSYWQIVVSDTGLGIPLSAQKHIFEPFGQVDGSITREFGGTGLGLSIVKQLTTLMGGEISLKSELGQGSIFTVLLPVQVSQ